MEVQFGRYQKNILQEWSMVKNLSCVSCAAWNVFPINSLTTGWSTSPSFALVLQHWCMKKLWENIKLVETLDCVACPLKRAKCALWKVLLSKSFQYLVYTFVLLPIHSVLFLRHQLKIASFWHPTWNQNLCQSKNLFILFSYFFLSTFNLLQLFGNSS